MEQINRRKNIFEILLLVFLLIALGWVIVFYLDNRAQVITSGKYFNYTIGKCDQSEADFLPSNVQIETKNHSLEFEHNLNIYCNANEENLKLELHKNGNTLEVREIFTSDTRTMCNCPIKIKGKINNLKAGKYNLSFVVEIADGKGGSQIETVGERVIDVQ
jgi:hypothetical protein